MAECLRARQRATGERDSRETVPTAQAAMAGTMAGGLVATLLSFGATVVLDVLNAVYVCFALDKDRACITRPEVHAIYVLLPSRCAPRDVSALSPSPSSPFLCVCVSETSKEVHTTGVDSFLRPSCVVTKEGGLGRTRAK